MEAGKGRKVRRTARRLHADLVVLGYDGSCARVAAFVRHWRADREVAQRTTGRGVFVPLVFPPADAFQFDWSEDWAVIDGKRVKLQAAHTKLAHSRAFVVRAYRLQTHEMLFDAIAQRSHGVMSAKLTVAEAFRVLGGVPRRGIFDNSSRALSRRHADRRRSCRHRQDAAGQRALCRHGQPLPLRADVLQPGLGVGLSRRADQRASREKRAGCPSPDLAGHAELLGSTLAQCVARGALRRALGRNRAWGPAG